MSAVPSSMERHLARLHRALRSLGTHEAGLDAAASCLADAFRHGGRLLAAGNGGSAAQVQHLTAELVGRFRAERRALSALALSADTASLTALANDYGAEALFARQVEAHGRPGDVLVLLSTSGRSANLLLAAERATQCDLRVIACTGALPNPLAERADLALAVHDTDTATIQEVHQVMIHLLCAGVEARLDPTPPTVPAAQPARSLVGR